ncbi:hypothetical protein HPB52_010362 [Rhipicephalus sanguineus]|uniref:Endonuclease/exonuclease/phosphatase domain-containing protein n=1 Tax=Rhipicephalus sanguineus TaxID=34632 RepID=A0A9D4PR31_RHISA|nr:hypothetical protein HPB52_010362 [Rhipicephalus sanguineus]
MTITGDSRLVIGGDFNAPHTKWGYGHSSKKGKDLADRIEKACLTLLNEPASHTRIGAGPHRDTTPVTPTTPSIIGFMYPFHQTEYEADEAAVTVHYPGRSGPMPFQSPSKSALKKRLLKGHLMGTPNNG